jgi:hypothetical protein
MLLLLGAAAHADVATPARPSPEAKPRLEFATPWPARLPCRPTRIEPIDLIGGFHLLWTGDGGAHLDVHAWGNDQPIPIQQSLLGRLRHLTIEQDYPEVTSCSISLSCPGRYLGSVRPGVSWSLDTHQIRLEVTMDFQNAPMLDPDSELPPETLRQRTLEAARQVFPQVCARMPCSARAREMQRVLESTSAPLVLDAGLRQSGKSLWAAGPPATGLFERNYTVEASGTKIGVTLWYPEDLRELPAKPGRRRTQGDAMCVIRVWWGGGEISYARWGRDGHRIGLSGDAVAVTR